MLRLPAVVRATYLNSAAVGAGVFVWFVPTNEGLARTVVVVVVVVSFV